MKRIFAPFFLAGVAACFTLSGCGEESKIKETETVSDPGGTTTKTVETKVKSTGDNPPAASDGTSGASPAAPK